MTHLKYIGSTDYLKLMGFKEIDDNYYRFVKEGKYSYTYIDLINRGIFIYQMRKETEYDIRRIKKAIRKI